MKFALRKYIPLLPLLGCWVTDEELDDSKMDMESNADPMVTIIDPNDGLNVIEGTVVTFFGTVSDSNHELEELSVSWVAGERVICPASPADMNGNSTCSTPLALGEEMITVFVTDPEGATGEDFITIVIEPYSPPTAE